jgi:hypothetical protein
MPLTMTTIVLILNGLIALLCLYVAWQLCRLRSVLANAADALTIAERTTHRVLYNAPEAIGSGQLGSFQLRQRYRLLSLQLQQVQQVLSLLGLGQVVWRYYIGHQSRTRTGHQTGYQSSAHSKRGQVRRSNHA